MYTLYHESFKVEKFHGFRGFLHVRETFLFVRFRKSFFVKVCAYSLPQNFSASKLSWYIVCFKVVITCEMLGCCAGNAFGDVLRRRNMKMPR